jgi:hypothetical protein
MHSPGGDCPRLPGPRLYGPAQDADRQSTGILKHRLDEIGVNPNEVVGTLVMIMRECTGSSDPAMVANALEASAALRHK